MLHDITWLHPSQNYVVFAAIYIDSDSFIDPICLADIIMAALANSDCSKHYCKAVPHAGALQGTPILRFLLDALWNTQCLPVRLQVFASVLIEQASKQC